MTTAYLPLGAVVVAGGKAAFADGAGMIVLPAPVVPPIEPEPPPSGGYAGGGGGRRIRQFAPRKRKREDEEEPLEVITTAPARPSPPPVPPPLPPQPGLMAGIPMPPLAVLRSPPAENDDDEAIALLLETLFS